MKRLNRNKVAELVRDYGNYNAWRRSYFTLGKNRDQNTEVEQDYFDYGYIYYGYMATEVEVRLAEMGIFIYDELSKERLAKWDWGKAHGEWRDKFHDYHNAEKAYDIEQKELEMDGAVA